MNIKQALQAAVNEAGGFIQLANLIGSCTSAPGMWKTRGSVPAQYCPAIEKATGIRCELLNPKVDWEYLRGTSKATKAAKRTKTTSKGSLK